MDWAKKIWKVIQDYVIVAVLMTIVLVMVLQLWRAELAKYPLQYCMGDDMTASMTVKTILENGWIYENPMLGAPGAGSTAYDSLTGEILLNVIQAALVLVTRNWVLSLNLFYLSGYYLCAWTALYVLKKLNMTTGSSIFGAVMFASAPYHFMRGLGHLYLSEYFMIPIMVLLVIRLMNQEKIWNTDAKKFSLNNIITFITLICCGLTGVYYAYFFCFFLCISILYKLLNRVSWKKCLQEVVCIVIVVISIGSSMIPSLIFWAKNGRSAVAIERNPVGAELYSMKLSQLILPITGHRISYLAELRNGYNMYPLTNENNFAALGAVVTIGFLCLLFGVMIKQSEQKQAIIPKLVVLNYSAILIGTIGSFSSIIGFLFSMIRGYNRISIFIAMFSIIMVCILLGDAEKWLIKKFQSLGHKHSRSNANKGTKKNLNNIWTIGLGYCIYMVLLAAGVWEQTSGSYVPNYDGIKQEFEIDKQFVEQVETLNPGGYIFQMPYVVYPEQGQVNAMVDYSHLKGYLHSDTLHWSYCATKGREADEWQKNMSEYPIEQQITMMEDAGFTGIYIDAIAYQTEDWLSLKDTIDMYLGDADVISSDGRLWYYGISN